MMRNITPSTPADGTMNTLNECIQGAETFLKNEPILNKGNDYIAKAAGSKRRSPPVIPEHPLEIQ
jgi:hypothetical protein